MYLKKKLQAQINYLPVSSICWDKDITDALHKNMVSILFLHKMGEYFDRDKDHIISLLKSVASSISNKSYDRCDLKYIIDMYYVIICWQKGIRLRVSQTHGFISYALDIGSMALYGVSILGIAVLSIALLLEVLKYISSAM